MTHAPDTYPITPELSALIETWIEQPRKWTKDQFAIPGVQALLISASLGGCGYIQSNGHVLFVEIDEEHPEEAKGAFKISLIVGAMETYPELRQLLPERPGCAINCDLIVCKQGKIADSNILCHECGGLGWTLPT